MDIRIFIEDDYPAIVRIHKSLNIVWPESPRTPEGWAASEQNRNPKCKFQRWVALVDGGVVGFGSYGQNIYEYHPQRFNVNVEVCPEYQHQGVGGALYDRIMAELQVFDPHVLRANAFTNLPQGFRFLQRRGFYEAFRETPVHLDIQSFDPSPYESIETDLLKKGYILKTLREMEIDSDRNQKLYDLYFEVARDMPHEDFESEKPTFEEWSKWGLEDPVIQPDGYTITTCGDKYVGLRELGKDPESDAILGGLLGVRRADRQQGIGLAMQLRGIAFARKLGCSVLKTCTAIQNHPMQALFNKLGYERGPEWLQCQKDL